MIESHKQRSAQDRAVSANVSSTVGAERIVDIPFSFTLAQADLIFAALQFSGARLRLPLRALGLPFGGALTHRVTTRFNRQRDVADRGRLHDEIAFDWSANSRWLPQFHGILRMRIESAKTRLVLLGDYVAPFGVFGVAFDRSIGRRLAQATAADLLDGLASELMNRWTLERRAG